MGGLGELFVDFAVNFKDAGLAIAKTAIGDLSIGALAGAVSVEGLANAFVGAAKFAANFSDTLYHARYEYGLNTKGLQGLQNQMLAYGVSTDKTAKATESLQSNLAAFQLGQGSDAFMQAAGFLGLQVGQGTNAEDLMGQLKKKLPSFVKGKGAMGRAEATNLIQQLGLSPDMLPALLGQTAGKGQGPKFHELTLKQVNSTESLKNTLGQTKVAIETTLAGGMADLAKGVNSIIPFMKSIADYAESKMGGYMKEGESFVKSLSTSNVMGKIYGGATGGIPKYISEKEAQKMAKIELHLHQTNHINGDASHKKIAEHTKRAMSSEITRATSSMNRN